MMSMHGKVTSIISISYHHSEKLNDDDTRQGGGLPDMGQGPDRRPAVEGGEDNRITVILFCFNRLESKHPRWLNFPGGIDTNRNTDINTDLYVKQSNAETN